jgi:hypothetical protein
LIPATFLNAIDYIKEWGADEYKRSLALEAHCVETINQLIKKRGWSKDVDLADNQHRVLLFSDEERAIYEADYRQVQELGIDVSAVEWLDKADVHQVCWRLFDRMTSL